MDDSNLEPLLARLSDNISSLEENLKPLLSQAISEKARSLPLLDRAKLYALVVYTIESLLFSYLRLHGVQATEHPIFRELTRVKQYFEKIKRIETGPEKPSMQLDKAAADRFIKHALSGDIRGGQSSENPSGADGEGQRKRKLDGDASEKPQRKGDSKEKRRKATKK